MRDDDFISVGDAAIRVLREIAVRDGLHGHVWRREFALAVEPDHLSDLVEARGSVSENAHLNLQTAQGAVEFMQRAAGPICEIASIFAALWPAPEKAVGVAGKIAIDGLNASVHCADPIGHFFQCGLFARRFVHGVAGKRLAAEITSHRSVPFVSFCVADCCTPGSSNGGTVRGESLHSAADRTDDEREGGIVDLSSMHVGCAVAAMGMRGVTSALVALRGDDRLGALQDVSEVFAEILIARGAVIDSGAEISRFPTAIILAMRPTFKDETEGGVRFCQGDAQHTRHDATRHISAWAVSLHSEHPGFPDGHSGLPLLARIYAVTEARRGEPHGVRINERDQHQGRSIGREAVRGSVATGAEDIGLVHAASPTLSKIDGLQPVNFTYVLPDRVQLLHPVSPPPAARGAEGAGDWVVSRLREWVSLWLLPRTWQRSWTSAFRTMSLPSSHVLMGRNCFGPCRCLSSDAAWPRHSVSSWNTTPPGRLSSWASEPSIRPPFPLGASMVHAARKPACPPHPSRR